LCLNQNLVVISVLTGGAENAACFYYPLDVTTGPAPLTVQFDGSGSTVDPFGEPLAYDWNFGDGSAPSPLVAPQHTYAAPGTYTVVLGVLDGLSQFDDAFITIPIALYTLLPSLLVGVGLLALRLRS